MNIILVYCQITFAIIHLLMQCLQLIAEERTLKLVSKFEELKKKGQVRKFIEKRRLKCLRKDRKRFSATRSEFSWYFSSFNFKLFFMYVHITLFCYKCFYNKVFWFSNKQFLSSTHYEVILYDYLWNCSLQVCNLYFLFIYYFSVEWFEKQNSFFYQWNFGQIVSFNCSWNKFLLLIPYYLIMENIKQS